jgi:hypothetical protein
MQSWRLALPKRQLKKQKNQSIAQIKEIAKGSRDTAKDNEDWSSLSATFDRAPNKPGAHQSIEKTVEKVYEQGPPSVKRSGPTAQDKEVLCATSFPQYQRKALYSKITHGSIGIASTSHPVGSAISRFPCCLQLAPILTGQRQSSRFSC